MHVIREVASGHFWTISADAVRATVITVIDRTQDIPRLGKKIQCHSPRQMKSDPRVDAVAQAKATCRQPE